MKQVQVIAGLEERLAMNRPVIQELLDQAQAGPPPLLGLDYLFEVLQPPQQGGETAVPPLYHCALCTSNHSLRAVMEHFTSVEHNLKFLKEFFPVAWARFSAAPHPRDWSESDLVGYEAALAKIETIHGRKKPSIVENEDKLEEVVDRIPVSQYTSRRAELDAFFKGLGPPATAGRTVGGEEATPPDIRSGSQYVCKPGVMRESLDLLPGASRSVTCQLITPVTSGTNLDAKFVAVTRHPSNLVCDVVAGFSRVFMEGGQQAPCIRVMVANSNSTPVKLQRHFDLAMVRWKR